MAKQIIDVKWNNKMSFTSDVNGHKLTIDANEAVGGEDAGPRPKPLMLAALGGCTGMDVVSMLKKMRVELDDFNMKIEAEMTEEDPKHYNKFHIIYQFKGKKLSMDKLEKAVGLSEEKYCGVSFMYKKFAELSSSIEILN
jgi:putative redox protein